MGNVKNYFGFQARQGAGKGARGRFLLIFALLLLPACGLWAFYRWLFSYDTHLLVVPFLALLTSWVCASLMAYGSEGPGQEE